MVLHLSQTRSEMPRTLITKIGQNYVSSQKIGFDTHFAAKFLIPLLSVVSPNTHTHTHTYIYIYISIFFFFFQIAL